MEQYLNRFPDLGHSIQEVSFRPEKHMRPEVQRFWDQLCMERLTVDQEKYLKNMAQGWLAA
jgi:hypothetical protein